MKLGPGIYDFMAERVREATQAEGVVLIVINGTLGTGFSVQVSAELTAKLPDVLEQMAQQLREDIAGHVI